MQLEQKMVAIALMRTVDGWLAAHWMQQEDTDPLASVVSDLEPNVRFAKRSFAVKILYC